MSDSTAQAVSTVPDKWGKALPQEWLFGVDELGGEGKGGRLGCCSAKLAAILRGLKAGPGPKQHAWKGQGAPRLAKAK